MTAMTAPAITAEQLDALLDRVKANRTEANLQALREANGITTTGTCTAEVVRVLRVRARQGYTNGEIALMTGLHRSTVVAVRMGRRGQEADRPTEGAVTTFREPITGLVGAW